MKTLAVLPAKDRSKKLHNQNLLPESAIRRLFSPILSLYCVSVFLGFYIEGILILKREVGEFL